MKSTDSRNHCLACGALLRLLHCCNNATVTGEWGTRALQQVRDCLLHMYLPETVPALCYIHLVEHIEANGATKQGNSNCRRPVGSEAGALLPHQVCVCEPGRRFARRLLGLRAVRLGCRALPLLSTPFCCRHTTSTPDDTHVETCHKQCACAPVGYRSAE